ncbi:MAG: 30S ribosomal protein S1 [Chlamydiae bacterium RIFCSPHIGHO2_12_FULL_49_11]|nr:MAG: 30S ribosomal protein S1 [Chlamydiae bacterium RIFCSPHIGHO2_12_FULL_49_11]
MPKQDTQKYFEDESKVLTSFDFDKSETREFENLLNKREKTSEKGSLNTFISGEILKGTIVEVTNDFVVVDVGLKSEGLIPIEEFGDNAELELGREVEVLLDQAEDDVGQIVLSREKARRERQWEYLTQNCEEGSIVKGKVVRKVKGGLMVDIDGMDAFLPGSQIDNKRLKSIDDYLGQTFEVKILKINLERKNIVVSRREILEDEKIHKKAEMLEDIHEGDIRRGIVKNITDFGVFLDLDGIDGLLHITDMTWKRIKHPSEIVTLGDTLDVMILNIDREKGRVALGLKQKESNPWDDIETRYPPGTRVSGTIVNMVPYGAFIELEPGIEGLIHVSEMSWVKNITDPTQVVNKGDEVRAIVLSIQKDEGKISLGIKQLDRNPWEDVEENYPIGKKVQVEVKSLTNYGAFVELEPGVEGLIHISDLSWIKKVSHPSEMLNKGDKVSAIVLSVDRESKKITLGVKQLSENPWDKVEKTMPIGSVVRGVVTRVTAFGAFLKLDNGIEGLVHINELSDQSFSKVEDVISIDTEIKARVLNIDSENKRVYLSTKEFLKGQSKKDQDDIVVTSSPKKKKETESHTKSS